MAADGLGVNLSTGKVSFPLTLVTASGPAGFGESVVLTYSTTGLVQQVQTWNEDAPTSVVGLGWNLETAYIMRMGNGSWQDSFYLVMGGSSLPLTLIQSPPLPFDPQRYTNNQSYRQAWDQLEFATQSKSLLKITYNVPTETWTVVDGDGVTFVFGGKDANGYSSAVDLGVRWRPADALQQQPLLWVGSSTETAGQENYATAWRLAKKTTVSGQKVLYTYTPVQQKVGPDWSLNAPTGMPYTVSNLLARIDVTNGDTIQLEYAQKASWEYPTFRTGVDSSAQTIMNAFQDRIETAYLAYTHLYIRDVNGNLILHHSAKLNYDTLYQHFKEADLPQGGLNAPDAQAMNKRVLTSIEMLTDPDQVLMMPAQEFDYWGLYDQELQEQFKPYKDTFKAVPRSALLKRNIKPGDPALYTGPPFNALFGHLKNIKSSEGGLTWYSYTDNSQDDAGKDRTDWELRQDLLKAITPPEVSVTYAIEEGEDTTVTVTGENPRPYWGDDQYVVLAWQLKHHGIFTTQRWIYFQIYEWVGKWVEVKCQNTSTQGADPLTFRVDDFGDIYVRVVLSQGKFVFVRTNISAKTTGNGTVALFHRDADLPGLWNVTYFSPQTLSSDPTIIPVLPVNIKISAVHSPENYTYLQADIQMGTDIVALLDRLSGRLHLYSLSNNQWHEYFQGHVIIRITNACNYSLNPGDFYSYTSSCSGLSVVGNDVFVLGVETLTRANAPTGYTAAYRLFRYDPTLANSPNGWTDVIPRTTWPYSALPLLDQLSGDGTYIAGVDMSPSQGFTNVQFTLNLFPATFGTTYVGRSVAASWDDKYQHVNLQPLYSGNNAAPGKVFWGSVLSEDPPAGLGFLDLYADLSGNISSSNLLNITNNSTRILPSPRGDSEVYKYMLRYLGGKGQGDNNQNIGWNCNRTLSSSTTHDPWVKMASFDTTVGIDSSAFAYKLKFFQFNPYLTLSQQEPNKPKELTFWPLQTMVNMGTKDDWDILRRVLLTVLDFISFFLIPVAPEIFAVEVAAKGFIAFGMRLINFVVAQAAQLGINYGIGLIQSAVMTALLSNSRTGDASLGLNYLLVGTNQEPSLSERQPRVYCKQWDEASHAWTWGPPTGSYNNKLSSLLALSPPFSSSSTGKTNHLAAEVYHYGNYFSPFSYQVNQAYTINKSSYEGQVYKDQIACLRNAVLSSLISLGNFTEYNSERMNAQLGAVSLPYCLYQGQDPFNLYAPWGGVLGYKPRVYTSQSSNGKVQIGQGTYFQPLNRHRRRWDPYGNNSSFFDFPSLKTALDLKFFVIQDEKASGALSDYVVDRVSVNDGYQFYHTCLRYMPQKAIYHGPLGSVVYNQVRLTTGAETYDKAILINGWTESYFYTGYTSDTGETQAAVLPYDPATDTSNPYYHQGISLTNANLKPNLLFNQQYATRQLKFDGSNPVGGFEIGRQYSYYLAYTQNLKAQYTMPPYYQTSISVNHDGAPPTLVTPRVPQQATGFIQTLVVNLSAPDDAQQRYIQNGSYVLTTQETFYDFQGYTGALTTSSGFETALPVSRQELTYHYVPANQGMSPQYTQTVTLYGFQQNTYQAGLIGSQGVGGLNLWNPVIQTTTYQTLNDRVTFQPVAATATTLKQTSNSQGNPYWYPYGSYRWVGTGSGVVPVDNTSIPWNTSANTPPLLPTNVDWQLSGYTRSIEDGITKEVVVAQSALNTTTIGGPLQTILYDQVDKLVIGRVTSPNLLQDGTAPLDSQMVRFCSFEEYEDLSGWATLNVNQQWVSLNIVPYTTTQTCYAGQRCLSLAQNPTVFYWGGAGQGFTVSSSTAPADTVVFSFFYAQQTTTPLTLNISLAVETATGQVVSLTPSPYLSLTLNNAPYAWQYEQLEIPLATLVSQQNINAPYTLWIGVQAIGPANTVFLDALSLTPLEANGNFYVYNLYPPTDPRYNTATELLVATLDTNGTTLRTAYDDKRRLMGTAQGCGTSQDMLSVPLLYYSRDGNQDTFSSSDPNRTTSLQASLGGQYFDFRTNGDTMGWYASPGILQVANNNLILSPRTTALLPPLPACQFGVGLRAHLNATAMSGAQMSIALVASGTVTIQWNGPTGFTLTTPTGSTTYATSQLPSDWLLLAFSTAVYFYADGQLILSSDLSTFPISFANVQPILSSTMQASFQDIMILQDPRFSTTFLDGTGRSRQVQTLSDLSETSSAQGNPSPNFKKRKKS